MHLVSKMFLLVNKTKEAIYIFSGDDYHHKKISYILEGQETKEYFISWQYLN